MKKQFGNRFDVPRLTAEQAERQGRVSRMAFASLGKSQAVIAFLNGHDAELGGRPIDLAIAGEEQLLRVRDALARANPA